MKKEKVIIIAEAGVNHNGDIKIAKKLIKCAADAKADYVKFQTFNADKLVSKLAKKAKYQKNNFKDKYDTQFQMLKRLELSRSQHLQLIKYCKTLKIKFLSTAFDIDSLVMLKDLGITLFKIPSGEITNLPYLKKVAKFAKKIIISTGMCTIEDINNALNIILKEGFILSNVYILHCNTEYPTPMKDVNLNAMLTIKNVFNVDVGYSDHTQGIEVPIAAVALGAKIIEKHFTLSKKLIGPDHKASLEPLDLKEMIKSIRNIEIALGNGVKKPSNSELKNISIARKSIHMKSSIMKGEIIKEKHLIMLRPGDGIPPMKIYDIIGKKSIYNLKSGHKLKISDLH